MIPDLRCAGVAGMKRLALGLLLAMLALLALAAGFEHAYPWLSWLRALAEAGSVGAIADWFAVTALFRHPLGLPIPHTAIIPRRKAEIGQALGRFVEENFLTPENLTRRFAGLDATGAAVRWLSSPENSRRCTRAACSLVPGLLERLDDAAFRRFLDQAVVSRLERLDVAAIAGRVLDALMHQNRHQALLDQGLRSLERWLADHRVLIREKFGEASRYTPGVVDRYVADRFVDGMLALFHEIAVNPEHEMRIRFDVASQIFVARLKYSPEYAAMGRELLHDLLAHLRSEPIYRSAWAALRRRIAADLASPASAIVASLAETLAGGARLLLADDALRARFEAWMQGAVSTLSLRHRHEIAKLITEVVASWDGEQIARKVEAEIGRDLQFIRINGTLVGAGAGLLLHGLGLAFAV